MSRIVAFRHYFVGFMSLFQGLHAYWNLPRNFSPLKNANTDLLYTEIIIDFLIVNIDPENHLLFSSMCLGEIN